MLFGAVEFIPYYVSWGMYGAQVSSIEGLDKKRLSSFFQDLKFNAKEWVSRGNNVTLAKCKAKSKAKKHKAKYITLYFSINLNPIALMHYVLLTSQRLVVVSGWSDNPNMHVRVPTFLLSVWICRQTIPQGRSTCRMQMPLLPWVPYRVGIRKMHLIIHRCAEFTKEGF